MKGGYFYTDTITGLKKTHKNERSCIQSIPAARLNVVIQLSTLAGNEKHSLSLNHAAVAATAVDVSSLRN